MFFTKLYIPPLCGSLRKSTGFVICEQAPLETKLNQLCGCVGVYPFVPIRAKRELRSLSGGTQMKFARIVMMMTLLVGGSSLIASAQDRDNDRAQDRDHGRVTKKDHEGDKDRDRVRNDRDRNDGNWQNRS